MGGVLGSKDPGAPNDHVNLSQSSKRTPFPPPFILAVGRRESTKALIPAIGALIEARAQKKGPLPR